MRVLMLTRISFVEHHIPLWEVMTIRVGSLSVLPEAHAVRLEALLSWTVIQK
jgi:hypothetical protein